MRATPFCNDAFQPITPQPVQDVRGREAVIARDHEVRLGATADSVLDGASITPSSQHDAAGSLSDINQTIITTRQASAAATVRQILDIIARASPDGPQDDAAVITLRII